MAWIRDLYDPELLEELSKYDTPERFVSEKARRVYFLCIERKHYKLARKIHSFFGARYHSHSDMEIAFAYAMLASKYVNK